MINRQTHYFPANDCSVVTGLCPNGEFGAYLETDDGRVRGYGHSRLAAIADLVEAVSKSDELPDDYRTPLTGEDAAQWQADRARSIAMAE